MATIGGSDIKIDIEALVKGLEQVQQLTNQLNAIGPAGQQAASGAAATTASTQQAGSAIGALTGQLRALAPAFSAAFVLRELQQTVNDLDDIAKAAARIGISAPELQKLQYAADLSGVSADQLDGILERLVRTVDDAATGSKSASEALGRLGLSAKDLAKLPLEQQFLKVGDALNQIEDSSQRAALAQEIFGRGNIEVLNITQQGSQAIRALGDELERIGGVASESAFQGAERFNDSLTKMGRAWEGLKIQLLTPVLPTVTAAIGNTAGAFDALGKNIGATVAYLTGAIPTWEDYTAALTENNEAGEQLAESISGASDAMDEQTIAANKSAEAAQELAKQQAEAAEQAKKVGEALKVLKIDGEEALTGIDEKSRALVESFETVAAAADESGKIIVAAYTAALEQAKSLRVLVEIQEDWTRAVDEGRVAEESAADAKLELRQRVDELVKSELKQVESLGDLRKLTEDLNAATKAGVLTDREAEQAKSAIAVKARELARELNLTEAEAKRLDEQMRALGVDINTAAGSLVRASAGFADLKKQMDAATGSASASRSAIVDVGLAASQAYREGQISAAEFNAIVSEGVPKFVELGQAGKESADQIKSGYDSAGESIANAIDKAVEARTKIEAARGGRSTDQIAAGDTATSGFAAALNAIAEFGPGWREWGEDVIRRYGPVDGGFYAIQVIMDKVAELNGSGVRGGAVSGVEIPEQSRSKIPRFSGGGTPGAGGSTGSLSPVSQSAQQASDDVDRLANKIEQLDGKTIDVTVNVKTNGAAALGIPS